MPAAGLTYINVPHTRGSKKRAVPSSMEDMDMTEAATKPPVKTEKSDRSTALAEWHPPETLQKAVDRVFASPSR